MNIKKKSKWSALIISFVYMVLGIFMIIRPDSIGSTLCYLLAIGLGVMGLINIVEYIVDVMQHRVTLGSNDLAIGIIMLCIAIFIAVQKKLVLSIIPFVLGFMIVVRGVILVQHAINLKRFGYSSAKPAGISAAIIVLLGLFAMMFPFATAKMFFMFMGVGLFVSGLIDFVASIAIGRQLGKEEEGIATAEVVEE